MSGLHLFEDEDKKDQSIEVPSSVPEETEENVEELSEFLTFRISDDLFAVPLLSVREVIEKPKLKMIPKCEPYFKGLFNLRGEIAGIIDLGEKFGIKGRSSEKNYDPVVLFDTENGPLGIVVDEMYQVFQCNPDDISDKASVKSKVPQKYLKGFIRKDDEIAIIIDLQLILDEDEITHFRKARDIA
ncbi:MAG: purine-binding chemotaxis protein CheW [Deltaproteobacteria bacterium]|nr:purine-binding chemotaxis protein CheW [Deltaproteobacteria bacterium]